MTSDMRWTDRLAIEMSECKHMGIKVLGPDINESYGDFGIVKGKKTIRFGLSGIKGMGKALVEEEVIPERERGGPFKSVCDFAKRINSTKFNKKSWEAAIKTGAFDSFNDRSDLLFNLEAIQAYGAKCQKDVATGQTDLFGAFGDAGAVPEPDINPAPVKTSEKEQLLWERDLMGLYLSAHPLDKYDTYFDEQTHPYSYVTAENDEKIVTIGGIITNIRTILTKSGTKMAFVKIENKTAEQEIVVFPSVFEQYGGKLVQDNVIKCTGKVNAKDKNGNVAPEVKVLAEAIEVVSDETLSNYTATGAKMPAPVAAPKNRRYSKVSAENVGKAPYKRNTPISAVQEPVIPKKPEEDTRRKRLFCLVKDPNNAEILTKIKNLCDLHPGFQEIILVLEDESGKKPLRMPFRVDADAELTAPLSELLGKDCVKVV